MLSPLYTTNESNDADLAKQLGNLADVRELACGDINHLGYWLDGSQVWVWGERKKLGDIINCLDSGRLLRQIQDARQAGFTHLYLILETPFMRANPTTGILETRTGSDWRTYGFNGSKGIQYSRLMGYLNQLRFYLNVHVYQTHSVKETAQIVLGIYSLFQTTPEEHSSLNQFAVSPEPIASFLQKPSLLRRMAKELPGIGWDRSKDMEEEFGSARRLCEVLANGDREALLGIEGIGKRTVEKIEEALE